MNEILLYILAIVLGDVVFNWLCFGLMTGNWKRWLVAWFIGLALVMFRHLIPMVGIWYLTCVLFSISHSILTVLYDSGDEDNDGGNDGNFNQDEVY